MVLRARLVEASIINTHSPFPDLLFNKDSIDKPIGVVYLLDESGCQEFGDLFTYGLVPLIIKAT